MIYFKKLQNRIIVYTLFAMLTLSGQQRIAIVQFESSGVDNIAALNITNRFSYELSKTKRFDIVEREMMDKILEEQKFQASGCVADECAVEIGQMIGVSQIVAGRVSKIENLYSLNIRLIDVTTGAILYQDMDDHEGKVSEFIRQTVKNMSLRMAAEASKKPDKAGTTTAGIGFTRKGKITFNINEPNVAIFIDGRYNSRSSGAQVILSIAEGMHAIKFSLQGFQDWEKDINVLADQELSYDVVMKEGAALTNDINTGILLVRSEPGNATVFVDGIEKGNTLLQMTDIGVGDKIIRVEKHLFHSYTEKITINPEEISEVKALLKPNFGSISFTSEPIEAVVMIDGQIKGKTPYSIDKLKSGEYNFQITKDLYHTHEENYIIVDGSENVRNIQLTPAFGKLIINSKPTNVDILLDGQNRGKTPFELDELPSGNYQLSLIKDLYQSLEQNIVIEDGETVELNFVLQARSGLLTVSGYPRGSNIFANGNKIGTMPLQNFRIAEGEIELKVSKENYHSESSFISIQRDESIEESFELKHHTGKIFVITEPPDAIVYLDGVEKGKTPAILSDIPVGNRQIKVSHPDYLENSESFNLSLNEKKDIRLKLITYHGSIQEAIDDTKSKGIKNIYTGLGFLFLGYFINIAAAENYKKYENAASTDEADKYYLYSSLLDKAKGAAFAYAVWQGLKNIYYQAEVALLQEKLLDSKVINQNKVNANSGSSINAGNNINEIYDTAPKPLRPIRPKYPIMAENAGVEGRVVIRTLIDDSGKVIQMQVVKGIPNSGLNEAAMKAIEKTRFHPATRNGRYVSVWIGIPVTFKLK